VAFLRQPFSQTPDLHTADAPLRGRVCPTPLSAPPAALAAEHRLLRTQLALSRARDVKPRRALIWRARWFNGR
jgi:hypothetical protein